MIASSSNVDDVVVDEKSNTKQVNIKEFEKNGFYTNPVANVNDAMAAAAEATTATSTTSTSSDGLASVSSASFVDQTMEVGFLSFVISVKLQQQKNINKILFL